MGGGEGDGEGGGGTELVDTTVLRLLDVVGAAPPKPPLTIALFAAAAAVVVVAVDELDVVVIDDVVCTTGADALRITELVDGVTMGRAPSALTGPPDVVAFALEPSVSLTIRWGKRETNALVPQAAATAWSQTSLDCFTSFCITTPQELVPIIRPGKPHFVLHL